MEERCLSSYCWKWRKLNSFTMFTSVVILLVFLVSSSNGQGNGGVNQVEASNGGSGSKCLPENYLAPVRATFQKLIPAFNSHSLVIQLRSDLRIQLGPDDPKLVLFLQAYYTTVQKELQQLSSDRLAGISMKTYFGSEYGRFLIQAGVPLSCLSYFAGVANTQDTFQLQQLAQTLQKRYKTPKDIKSIFDPSITGKELVALMRLKQPGTSFSISAYLTDTTRDQVSCEQILLYMKDGSIMIRLPIISIEMKSLYIPGKTAFKLGQIEVPFQVGRYLATGLNCLDILDEKKNFTHTVLDWISEKLIPQLIQTPTCTRGFSAILPFMMSVQDYADTLDRSAKLEQPLNQPTNDYYPTDDRAPASSLINSYSSIQKIRNGDDSPSHSYILPPAQSSFQDDRLKGQENEEFIYEYEPEEEKKAEKTSWFFTLFMMLILIMLIFALFMISGTRPKAFLKGLKSFGMNLGKRRRELRSKPSKRKYNPLTTDTEGVTSDQITSKEAPMTLGSSMRRSIEKKEDEESDDKSKKPRSKKRKKHHRHHDKRPLVQIHQFTSGDSMKVTITTDAEDCCVPEWEDDEICTGNKVNFQPSCVDEAVSSTGGSEGVYISECDFDDGSVGVGEGNSKARFVDDEGCINSSETTGSSVKLNSTEKKHIYERYVGPNEYLNDDELMCRPSRLKDYG